jgi:hypothetical protein
MDNNNSNNNEIILVELRGARLIEFAFLRTLHSDEEVKFEIIPSLVTDHPRYRAYRIRNVSLRFFMLYFKKLD